MSRSVRLAPPATSMAPDALGIKGRPIGAEALEGQVNAAHDERCAADGIAARKADHASPPCCLQ